MYESRKTTHFERFGVYYTMLGVLAVAAIFVCIIVFAGDPDASSDTSYSSAADYANKACVNHGGVANFRDSDEADYVTGVCLDHTAFSGDW